MKPIDMRTVRQLRGHGEVVPNESLQASREEMIGEWQKEVARLINGNVWRTLVPERCYR